MAVIKGIPHIATDDCKGCGLCVFICPESVLSINSAEVNLKGYNPTFVESRDQCIACISCALMCPDIAISVERITGKKEN